MVARSYRAVERNLVGGQIGSEDTAAGSVIDELAAYVAAKSLLRRIRYAMARGGDQIGRYESRSANNLSTIEQCTQEKDRVLGAAGCRRLAVRDGETDLGGLTIHRWAGATRAAQDAAKG